MQIVCHSKNMITGMAGVPIVSCEMMPCIDYQKNMAKNLVLRNFWLNTHTSEPIFLIRSVVLGRHGIISVICNEAYHGDNVLLCIVFSGDVFLRMYLKMYSKLYRYNSDVVSIVANSLFTRGNDKNGYVPLYGGVNYEPKTPADDNDFVFDSLKIDYLERMIVEYKDKCRLLFAISPMYFKRNNEIYRPVADLCEKYSVPLLNHNNDTMFMGRRNFFKDGSHMNNDGAVEYSKRILQEIEPYIR